MQQQEAIEDIVVVGAGLAGLATALGLHRRGVRSLVLESSPALRTSGFAFTAWQNAFRALDALGVGDKIRKQHPQAQALHVMSSSTGEVAQELDLTVQPKRYSGGGCSEIRCVRRDLLVQALEEELPRGTIRYSSRIVSIQEDGNLKVLQLADGSELRAKVLIGCDGINSVVAKWLGLAEPTYSGRMAARGLARFPDGHGFEPKFLQFNGRGLRSGMRPCNDTDIYWFFSWTPTENDKAIIESGTKLKRFVLANLAALNVPAKALAAIEASDDVFAVPLRFRPPLSLIAASISKGGVCVAGDALHPMTPDLGQGACAALEDSVVLARCLGDAMLGVGEGGVGTDQEHRRVHAGLREYAAARWWRSVQLIVTAYVVGFMQQSNNAVVSFVRDKILSAFLARILLKMSDYDCGTLRDIRSSHS